MEDTKDPKIISYTEQARQAKALQYAGFGVIPLGIAASLVYYKAYGTVYNPMTRNYGMNPDKNKYLAIAATLGVVAIACPVTAIIHKIKRNNCNAQAVRLYNQKF